LFPFNRYRRIFFAIEENRRGGAGVAAGRLSWSKIVLLHLASSVFWSSKIFECERFTHRKKLRGIKQNRA
jgi:hypothetical protein